jgi:hypothetical protein
MIRIIVLSAAIVAIVKLGASAEEPTKDLLAAQIRDQGFRCTKPISAHKDIKRSRADEVVWRLRCENATYRIRLIPDMAARVQRL